MKQVLLVSCFILGSIITAFASHLTSRIAYLEATFNDQLASPIVYQLYQDKSGKLWILSDAGISRYDGNRLEKFDFSQGLPDRGFYKVFEDELGRLWFYCLNNELYIYDKGHFKRYSFDFRSKKNKYDILANFRVTSEDELLLSYRNFKHCLIDKEGNITWFNPTNNQCLNVYEKFADYALIFRPQQGKRLTFNCVNTYNDEGKNNVLSLQDSLKNYVIKHYVHRHSGTTWIAIENLLVQVSKQKISTVKLEGEILDAMFVDDKGNLFVGTRDKGCFMFPGADISRSYKKIASGYSVTDVIQDNEGGYWLSTLGKGLLFIPDLSIEEIITYQGLSIENIELMGVSPPHLYLIDESSLFREYTVGTEQMVLNHEKLVNKVFRMFIKNRKAYLGHLKQLSVLNLEDYTSFAAVDRYPRDFTDHNGVHALFRHEYNSILRINDDGNSDTVLASDMFALDAKKMLVMDDNKVYLGGKDGLLFYQNLDHRGKPRDDPRNIINAYIKGLELLNDNHVMVITRNSGLFIVKDTLIKPIRIEKELESFVVRGICRNDQHILLYSREKFCVLSIADIQKSRLKNEGLRMRFIPIEGQIIDAEFFENEVFVTTHKGLFRINPENAISETPELKLVFDQFKINSNDTTFSAPVSLYHDENDLEIYYRVNSLRNADNLIYEYRLMGKDTNWRITTGSMLNFPNLSAGDYHLQIRLSQKLSINSNDLTFKFEILPPFWKTWWFIFITITLFLAAVIFVIKSKFDRDKQQLQSQIDLWTSKYQSLSSQLSPHFIFNTLQSINYFAGKHPAQKVTDFVGNFAKLMRRVLDNATHQSIPLSDEIEVLNRYLDLEKERLRDAFSYHIEVEESLETDMIKIPPMYIQPYLENAIQHGLPLNGEGIIDISFCLIRHQLVCEIKDNGVGITKQSMQYPSGKIHSFQINDERTSLLKKIHQSSFSIEVINRAEIQKNETGTLVRITFPAI